MKSLRLRQDGLGDAKLEALALPFVFAGPTATDDDAARMPPPELATAYDAVRTVTRKDGDAPPADDARHLLLVVSGGLDVRAGEMNATLVPGDVLFVDDPGAGATVVCRDECRLVRVDVADAWRPEGAVPPPLDEGRDTDATPRIRHMYVENEQARFRAFDAIFDDDAVRPVTRGSFFCLSPDSFGDWHTEEPSSLVVVFTGGFELEVGGGGGAVEVFGPGDVCLVQDQRGQGHITRTHGETRFAAFVVPDDRAWGANS